MKALKAVFLCVLLLFSANLFAYGGGGSSATKACTKPEFSDFSPAHLAEVAKGAAFSFTASKSTSPSSIEVTVKGLPVDVEVKETQQGFLISGQLPDSLQDTYARINIDAKSNKKCFGNDGWLVKISP